MNPSPDTHAQTQKTVAPAQVEPFSPFEIYFSFNTGEEFALPYIELRFHCPCAVCVNEHTGARMIQKEGIAHDVRVIGAQAVGRYALQITFSDQHETGIFHFETLYKLCKTFGTPLKDGKPVMQGCGKGSCGCKS